MRNKKGFTIIEIIICISLLVVIGVGSFISIKVISKKQLVDKLNMISTKASEAAQVYIETNKNASNQLYNNKNGVSLPLQLLVNEGYLSLEGTKLTNNDIKNQYVVTFLGGTGSTENCEQITSTNSWSNNQPIYLCMNSDGSGSNLATIDPTKYGNKTIVSNETYYFKGRYPDNYVDISNSDFDGKDELKNAELVEFRILSIGNDDSISLFAKVNGPYGGTSCYEVLNKNSYSSWDNFINKWKASSRCITTKDLYNTVGTNAGIVGRWICSDTFVNTGLNNTKSGYYYESCNDIGPHSDERKGIIIELPSNIKINSGTGIESKPYILKSK